jgi:hypothetical protein
MLQTFSVDITSQNQRAEKQTWQILFPFVRVATSLWETDLHLMNGITVLALRRLGGAVQPNKSIMNLDRPNSIAEEYDTSVC